MKYIFYLFLYFFSVHLMGQVYTSPLEYNTNTYYQKGGQVFDTDNAAKLLYPLNSNHFYLHDTISIPFMDDFSKDHFKTYYHWDWQAPFDSIARNYLLIPDSTIAGVAVRELKYSLTPTKHYFLDTINNEIDSTNNIQRQLILFGNDENPFVPVDTLLIYLITSKLIYFDSTILNFDSTLITPDGIITDDSTDLINVYRPLNDSSYWIDNFTYLNKSMGVDPPTIGVVTFDGTNEFGKAYAPGAVSSYGVNDYLTSKPIHLNLPAADSIYLSFFVQPKGLGYRPEEKDSITLEFYSPTKQKWFYIWSSIGDTMLDPIIQKFRQVMIPIKSNDFLQDGFKFRFKNYGNRSGNLDHWNLDYVRLDRLRDHADTLLEDVAFVEIQPTILLRYREMPYTQFQQTEIDSKWLNKLSNLFNANKTITYNYDVRNEGGTVINAYPADYTTGPNTNAIIPYITGGYSNYVVWSDPDFNEVFPTFTDTTVFNISHYISCTSTDINNENDSILLRQEFKTHFAYDDGTAEQSIWLGTPGEMVVKFRNNFPDTLRAIQFYFSPIKDDVNSRFITLKVYQGGLNTSNLLYSESRQIGVNDLMTDAAIVPVNNGFTTYILRDSIPLPAGDFYVGWSQNVSFKINVGFDLNTNASGNTFYKTTGVFDTLTVNGTAMIRPILGPDLDKSQIGLEEITENDVVLYPNPANDIVMYRIKDGIDISKIEIMDATGKLISSNANTENTFSVSHLAAGLYFVLFHSDTTKVLVKKLIKN